MRLHVLSIYAAVGMTISAAAIPIGSSPCHDESVIPDNPLPPLSPPPQNLKPYTEKPSLPYAASLSPPPAPKVENFKPQKTSYPPALYPKPKPEDKFFSPAPALKPHAAPSFPSFPPPSKEKVPKPEKTCALELVPEPFPVTSKPTSKEGKYKRQEKPNSFLPPPNSPLPAPNSPWPASNSPNSPRPTTNSPWPAPNSPWPAPNSPWPAPNSPPPPPKSPLPAPKSPLPAPNSPWPAPNSPLPPPPPPPSPLPYSEMTKSWPWAKTKLEEKPKPDTKSVTQKQPNLEQKDKSEKNQRPQDHFTKATTPERLQADGTSFSPQTNSVFGPNSIGIPTNAHCLMNGYSTNGKGCPKELTYARRGRGISTVSWRSNADR